jgi:glycine cleavage system H protein
MSSTETKTDRRYTKDHEWAKDDGSEVLIGISAFAVEQLGDITLVSLDVKVGDTITVGKVFGTIESVKTLSDLYAPLSGTVVRINENLEHQPELINDDPWNLGWMLAIEPTAKATEEAALLDATAYAAHVEASAH